MNFHLPKPLRGWREFFGEVGVIVLGVMIALAAQQVVEWAHSRYKQHETLERLFEEARVNVAELRNRQPDAAAMQREIEFATDLTKGKSCPPTEKWTAVETLNMYRSVTVRTSVYDEIIGAGGLAELESTRARDAVAAFHSTLSWVQAQTDFFRSLSHAPVPVDDPRLTLIYDPDERDPAVTTFNREALCGDRRFRSRVVDSVRDHVVWDRFRLLLTQDAIRMCGVLGQELDKECTPSEGTPFTEAERRVAETAARAR